MALAWYIFTGFISLPYFISFRRKKVLCTEGYKDFCILMAGVPMLIGSLVVVVWMLIGILYVAALIVTNIYYFIGGV